MFCSFPWEGVDMSIGNIIVDTSRTAYAAGGFKRVAGFGRNWSNPAYFALIATVLNYSYIKHIKFRHIILVLVFFIGILISTNKGAIITFLIISFFAVIIRKVPSYILKIVMLATLLIVIALPLLSWNEVLNVDYSSLVSRIIFSSFKARVEDVWPQALILIKEHGSLIFGRGIGGIGAPQLIFEPSIYHPADNLFIYLYGLFGVFSCVIFAYLGVKIMVLSIKDSRDTIFVAYLILSFLGIGVIGSALENGILNFFFGIMLASLYSQKIKFISSSVSDLPS
ncbi:lipid A core - O-antigen ligase [Saccharicrinis fermentans DSM 9555 = JCM 21142]|uniref:Lipid A core-O-antigen ligase n=3 Tax=Saccharicrinis fermentans TaxID=982 RepID=W7Y259_9BACT|nr:lipid A core - O-antigen ligase [Saccharicrinis fermentans DSM 9555 = JCM 21142]